MTSPTIFSPSVPRSSPSLSGRPPSFTIFRHSEYVRMGYGRAGTVISFPRISSCFLPLSLRPTSTWSTISSIIAMTCSSFSIHDISPSKDMNSVTWRFVFERSARKAGAIS